MSFLAFLLQINYFICTFKGYVFIEYTEYALLQRWHSETVTLALLSCQKLKNRFCRYHSSGVVNKLPQSLVTEEYVHGRKSEFEMKMFLKFGSYLITHLPVCSVCVEAPWPEARKGKELSAFISVERKNRFICISQWFSIFSRQKFLRERSYLLPFICKSRSQTWSQRRFNVYILSIQSICSETVGLALPERSAE